MNTPTPKQGEIWIIRFDPTVGSEVRKTRPALVVNADDIGLLPLRIVVPITSWDDAYTSFPWFVPIQPNADNGLVKSSAADAFQIKSVSQERFERKLGSVTASEFVAVLAAITTCLEPRDDLEISQSSQN